MNAPTEIEYRQIADYLAPIRLSATVREELLDHLCCGVESRMEGGVHFAAAWREVRADWPPERLLRIGKDIHYTTSLKPMLLRFSATAALLAGFVFLSPLSPIAESAESIVQPCREPGISATVPALGPQMDRSFDPPSSSPIAGMELTEILASGFGMRMNPLTKKEQFHRGIDLRAPSGTAVLATADGRVVYAGIDGNYGITVRILHEDGYVTTYAHLSKHIVARGDRVLRGQEIAAVGSTGISSGPHLHYEVLKDDRPVDPLALLD